MKKLLLTMLLLCGVVMGQEKAADNSNQPALTIYNQNFFVAREYVPLDLTAGVNRAQFAGIARILSRIRSSCAILPGAACRCLSRTIATILSRRNCCFRFMKARLSTSWCSVATGRKSSKARSSAADISPALTTRKTISSRLSLSPSSKWMACCASDCPASRCFPRSLATPSSSRL